MYIRFVLDPFVPHGINKVIRRVVWDLRKIFKDVTHSVETDESLGLLSKRDVVPVSKIFQRKLPMVCKGIAVYILNVNLVWFNNPIYGISSPNKCIVGLRDISKNNYKTWAAKIWDLVLHELGHSFGLIRKNRAHSSFGVLGARQGANHCLNDCVMSEDKFDFVWIRKACKRFDARVPYCEDCLKHLLAKDV